jgi:hypothetical protein
MAKKCRTCGKPANEWDAVYTSTQRDCSPACAIEYSKTDQGRKAIKKVRRAETRERKQKLISKSEWIKKAQYEAYNPWVRARDRDDPCISCGRTVAEVESQDIGDFGYWDCGHYRSIGSCPELRFHPLNGHKQCKRCNGGDGKYGKFNRKSALVHEQYREGLIAKLGLETVEWIEGPHEAKHYTIDDLKEIIAKYKRLKWELDNAA